MAFRSVVQRAKKAAPSPASAAAGAAATAAALGLGGHPGTADCDFQPDATQGLRVVQLDTSWEDLLGDDSYLPKPHSLPPKGESRNSSLPRPADRTAPAAAAAEAAVSAQADTLGRVSLDDAETVRTFPRSAPAPPPPPPAAAAAAATTGGGGGRRDGASLFLLPPSRDEMESAIVDVEAMLKDGTGSFLSSSWGSGCDATASIEASERALLRAKTLMDSPRANEYGSDSWAPDSIVGDNSSSSSIHSSVPSSLRLPRPSTPPFGGVISRGSSEFSLAHQSSQRGLGDAFSMRAQMADVLSTHREAVSSIVLDCNVWDALLQNEQVQQILRKEGAPDTEGLRTPLAPDSSTKAEQASDENNNGPNFFARLHAKFQDILASFYLLFQGPGRTHAGGKGASPTCDAEEGGSQKPWSVVGGILAVVIVVAFAVLMGRARRGFR